MTSDVTTCAWTGQGLIQRRWAWLASRGAIIERNRIPPGERSHIREIPRGPRRAVKGHCMPSDDELRAREIEEEIAEVVGELEHAVRLG